MLDRSRVRERSCNPTAILSVDPNVDDANFAR